MVVERVLDAFAVSGSAAARDAAARMMRWLARAPETDAALNDHFPGMAPTTEALSAYAERCGIVPTGGPTAGGARDSAEPGAHAAAPPTYPSATRGPFTVVFDVGNIGPDHVPGHAHADTLQVLLWYAGTPVLVDTGTSSYDDAEVRRYERGSAAHNTVHIGEDSSEMWGSFRVGRRARPLILHQATDGADIWRLSASHTGYTHLGVLHERAVELTPARVMVVDRLRPVRGGPLMRGCDPPRAPHSLPRAEAHWICAAGLTVTPVSGSTGAAAFRAGPIRFEFRGHRDVQREYRPVAAGYEKRVETATLRVVFTNELETIIEPAT
jgi:hypothetical protein